MASFFSKVSYKNINDVLSGLDLSQSAAILPVPKLQISIRPDNYDAVLLLVLKFSVFTKLGCFVKLNDFEYGVYGFGLPFIFFGFVVGYCALLCAHHDSLTDPAQRSNIPDHLTEVKHDVELRIFKHCYIYCCNYEVFEVAMFSWNAGDGGNG